jgi:ribosomal protein L1
MSTASFDLMAALHGIVAEDLTRRIKDGTATAADISNAIKFLKDNGIEARADKNAAVASLASQFPVFDDEREQYTGKH